MTERRADGQHEGAELTAYGRLWRAAVTLPVRHPRRTLLITLVLVALSIACITRIRADASMESMFAGGDPASKSLLRVLNHFSAAEEMLLLVSLSNEPSQTPQIDKLTSFAERLEGKIKADAAAGAMCDGVIYRVEPDTMEFFKKVLAPAGIFYLDDKQFSEAKQRLTPEGMREQLSRNEALMAMPGPAATALAKVTLQDPLHLYEFILPRLFAQRPFQTYRNSEYFLSGDGRNLMVRIRGKRPPSDIEFAKAFVARIRQIVDQTNPDGLAVSYAGAYPIATASEHAIRRDMVASATGSVIFLQLLFLLAYRSPVRWFAMAFLPVVLGVLFGFAVHWLIQPSLTPMTGAIGSILAGLAIDYAVFLLAHYDADRRRGLSASDAACETAVSTTPALLAAWATSIIGFLAIAWSSIPAVRDFAVLGALGLAGSFLSAVFVLPAVLVLVDRRKSEGMRPMSRFSVDPFIRLASRYRGTMIILSALTVIASGVVLFRSREGVLPLERDMTVMHPRPNAALDAQAEISRRFGIAPDSLIIHLQADSPEALLTLSHRVRDRLADPELRRTAGIGATLGLADLLPDPAQSVRRLAEITPEDARRIPGKFREAVAASAFDPKAYEAYAEFLSTLLSNRRPPAISDLQPYKSLSRLLLTHAAVEGTQPPTDSIEFVFPRTALNERDQREIAVSSIRRALADTPGATLTGMSVISLDAERLVQHDLPRLVGIAAVAVALYLLIHFRSLSQGVLASLPTVCALIVLLAAMRLADERLNLVNLVAAPLLIGLGVDYGVFFVSVFAARTRQGQEDLPLRIGASGIAVVMCAASTILGFGSLYYTSVPAVQSLGFAVGVGVLACFVFTFCLLLPILHARRG